MYWYQSLKLYLFPMSLTSLQKRHELKRDHQTLRYPFHCNVHFSNCQGTHSTFSKIQPCLGTDRFPSYTLLSSNVIFWSMILWSLYWISVAQGQDYNKFLDVFLKKLSRSIQLNNNKHLINEQFDIPGGYSIKTLHLA